MWKSSIKVSYGNMSEESNVEEVNTFRSKRRNKINYANKNIPGIVDEVVTERPKNESRVKANSFLGGSQ